MRSGVTLGHIWPLVEGRTIFAELSGGLARLSEVPRPWVSRGAVEVAVEDEGEIRWFLHTADEWSFDRTQTHAAKMQLITLVRRLKSVDQWLPPSRALSLHDDSESMRIWMVTSAVASVREALEQAAAAEWSLDELKVLLAGLVAALDVAERCPHVVVRGECLDAFGLTGSEVAVLAIPCGDDEGGTPLVALSRELVAFLDALPGRGLRDEDIDALLDELAVPEGVEATLRSWLGRAGG